MTPAARLSAAIEILDEIAARGAHADETIKAWGKAHRFAGSGDRRAIARTVYDVLRKKGRLAWWMEADDGRSLVIALCALEDQDPSELLDELFSGEGHAPAKITDKERRQFARMVVDEPDWVKGGVPDFVADSLKATFGPSWLTEARGLIGGRAPVDLRVNALRGDVEAARRLLAVDGFEPAPTPFSALGLRLPAEVTPDIHESRAWATGWIEVQDEASQIAAALSGAKPGLTVIDWCAGGGGKTLALAAQMRNQGRLLALDVDNKRLDALAPRLKRSDARAEVRRLPRDYLEAGAPAELPEADLVFVDAPCTGSGTWRRHPEAAWRLKPDTVSRLAMLQRSILDNAAQKVRLGGCLAYATCSVLPEENHANAAAFAAQHSATFRPVPIAEAAAAPQLTNAARARLVPLAAPAHTLQMTPHSTGTDGFFIALFERIA